MTAVKSIKSSQELRTLSKEDGFVMMNLQTFMDAVHKKVVKGYSQNRAGTGVKSNSVKKIVENINPSSLFGISLYLGDTGLVLIDGHTRTQALDTLINNNPKRWNEIKDKSLVFQVSSGTGFLDAYIQNNTNQRHQTANYLLNDDMYYYEIRKTIEARVLKKHPKFEFTSKNVNTILGLYEHYSAKNKPLSNPNELAGTVLTENAKKKFVKSNVTDRMNTLALADVTAVVSWCEEFDEMMREHIAENKKKMVASPDESVYRNFDKALKKLTGVTGLIYTKSLLDNERSMDKSVEEICATRLADTLGQVIRGLRQDFTSASGVEASKFANELAKIANRTHGLEGFANIQSYLKGTKLRKLIVK